MLSLLRKSGSKFYYKSIYPCPIKTEIEQRADAEKKIKAHPTDKDVCLEAVKVSGILIKHANFTMINKGFHKEICLEAVTSSQFAIILVQDFYISCRFLDDHSFKEICLKSVKNHSVSIKFVLARAHFYSEIFLTEICLETVKIDPWAIMHILNRCQFL